MTDADIKLAVERLSTIISTPSRNLAFGKRLILAFDTDKPAEIARKLGITYQGAKNYLDGRMPSVEKLVEISRSTGCSIHWLLTGEGPERADVVAGLEPGEVAIYFGAKEQEIIRDLARKAKRNFAEEVRDLVFEQLKQRGLVTDKVDESNLIFFGEAVRAVTIPLMGEIAAGEPIHAVARDEQVQVPDFFMKRGKRYMALRVRGDSMIEDGIVDGSLIICEARTSAVNGERVVALIDGEKATVKKIFHEGERIRLQPANPEHQPIYLGPDRTLDIQGVVVGIFHRPS